MSNIDRPGAIFVVNPNSTQAVTDGMDAALEDLRGPAQPEIRCLTLAEGPPGVESDADVRAVVPPLIRLLRELEPEASAFVDACFSDPGLSELRRATSRPVFGIAESAYRQAAKDHGCFGVVSILEASVPRHRRYIEALGLSGRLAGDRPLGLGVTALGDDPAATFARLAEVGSQLKKTDGAEAIVLGCTGMAPYRARLAERLELPVIDPVRAAVAAAQDAIARTALETRHGS